MEDYDKLVEEKGNHVIEVMAKRSTPAELSMIRGAFELAREAHAPQVRNSGEPYILHPIAVANIVAEEMQLTPEAVAAAFLHDVVEDTPYTIEEISQRFGDDVAYLVRVVTKNKGKDYKLSKQLDNYKQLLDSVQYDIRAILIKLADRLHNMRTLASMRPDKQMKIAGETDYFYAPLANRLGLYNIKTELENLSFRYRCPHEYEEMCQWISNHVEKNRENLDTFKSQIEEALRDADIKGRVVVDYRRPFSLWRKMKKYGDDFNHLKYRHCIEVIFDETQTDMSEKEMAMKVYCVLTNRFREKHCGMSNYIDAPKENGYQSIHVKLLPDFARWQEVHISSERMIRHSQIGCVSEKKDANIARWIEKFRRVLRDSIKDYGTNERYMEDIVSSFYNDDIQVFTPKGENIILPQGATVLDFAYELHTSLGNHAKYATINGRLDSVITPLRRGDVVEVFTDPNVFPGADWEQHVRTYKAKNALRRYRQSLPAPPYIHCPECNPIPGEEVIGLRNYPDTKNITVHKRDCRLAISKASSFGEDVISVAYAPDDTLYPVTISVRAVDRHHLLIDLTDCITSKLGLSMSSLEINTEHSIVSGKISLAVHSYQELRTIIMNIASIDGVDEVRRIA